MAERIVNGYKRLFEVRLLHHYWLDEGATIFDLIPDAGSREKRLLAYDVRPLLAVAPGESTTRLLQNLRCVYRSTALGFVVAAPAFAEIPADATFEFVLTVQSAGFFHYTALTWEKQKIYELHHPVENQIYRYKENVPVFSNLTGTTRSVQPVKQLFLSKAFPAPSALARLEWLVEETDHSLHQVVNVAPAIGQHLIHGTASDLPAFAHQDDAPLLTAPAGLSGVPERGILLSADRPDPVFALVNISATKVDDPDFGLIDGNGHPKSEGPVFQIRFKNRLTTWKYYNKVTGAHQFTEPVPLPLTYWGNAGVRRKPTGGDIQYRKTVDDATDPGYPSAPFRLISEIFE